MFQTSKIASVCENLYILLHKRIMMIGVLLSSECCWDSFVGFLSKVCSMVVEDQSQHHFSLV